MVNARMAHLGAASLWFWVLCSSGAAQNNFENLFRVCGGNLSLSRAGNHVVLFSCIGDALVGAIAGVHNHNSSTSTCGLGLRRGNIGYVDRFSPPQTVQSTDS